VEQCVAAVFEVVAKDMKDLLDIIGDDISELYVFADELKQQASAYPLLPPKWEPANA
jgi:DNA-binding ferritin-like protein (Dps family)